MRGFVSFLVLALFALVAVAQEDCEKDCAGFVTSKLDELKKSHATALAACTKEKDEMKKEHDDTIASLQAKLKELEGHTSKAALIEKELRKMNKELEEKWSKEVAHYRVLLNKAEDLAKRSQIQVAEAKAEIQDLIRSMSSTRINFKAIREDILGMWKRPLASLKKVPKDDEKDETKSEI